MILSMKGFKPSIQVVWFKRDLRIRDHRPLGEAASRGPVLPLYIVEPGLLREPDFDPSHWTFIQDSLRELRDALAALGQPLVVRIGEALPVFQALADAFELTIWSHEETGNGWTYARDRAFRRWTREAGIERHELPANGVTRRLQSRDAWAALWEERMQTPVLSVPLQLQPAPVEPGPIPSHADLGLPPDARAERMQRGGESRAAQVMESFFADRGAGYRSGLSSPLSAEHSCSRLSPYLAWGNLSVRQAVQETRRQIAAAASSRWASALAAFESRLHWHCHFIQKLEDEPRIEFENLVHGYDGLREAEFDAARFAAWQAGETGYPMIDASMRMLRATGWLNFRMRSMLVAFAAYDLWLHWREPSIFLARQFVDYEPGIHYAQMQMQSGTAGHATIRLYNPIKQGQDHDPKGVFVRRWIPELRGIPTSFLHAPWLLPREQQLAAGCVIGRDYPAPVVDYEQAMAHARKRIADIRRNPALAVEIAAVFEKHGSRRKMDKPMKKGPDPKQMRLF